MRQIASNALRVLTVTTLFACPAGARAALYQSDPARPETPELVEARRLVRETRYPEAEGLARRLLAASEGRDPPDAAEMADVLDVLVEALWRGGKVASPETQRLAERAVTLKEQAWGAEDARVAVSLNHLAVVHHLGGERDQARSYYERALSIREKALGPEHPDVATLLSNYGVLLGELNDRSGAIALHQRALTIREKVRGPEHPDVAQSLHNLALLRWQGGDVSAKALAERAVAIRETTLGPVHALVGESLNLLGVIMFELQGDYAGARPVAERALGVREQALGAGHPAVAESLTNLGNILSDLGDPGGAKPLYERALAINEEAFGSEHEDVALNLNNLASIRADLGDPDGARPLYERSLAIRERVFGAQHPLVAETLGNLGRLLFSVGELSEARSAFERALAVREKALGPEHPLVAETSTDLADLLASIGDREPARRLYERALAVAEKALGPNHPHVGRALSGLASLLEARGELAEASRLQRRVLGIRESAFGPEHPLVAETLAHLAALYRSTDQAAEALPAALRAEALSREHLRLTFRVLPESRALRLASVSPPGLDLALSLADATPDPTSGAAVWDALVRSRALVLSEMASRRQADAGADPSFTTLQRAFEEASQRLANLRVRAAADAAGPYRRVVDAARREMEAAEEALAEKSATFRRDRSRHDAGLAEVVAALPEQSALVAFGRYELPPPGEVWSAPPSLRRKDRRDKIRSGYVAFLWVGQASAPTILSLGAADEIDGLARRWSRQVADAGRPGVSPATSEASSRRSGARLRERVWDPVARHLGDVKRVFVVPEGALNLVNFYALPLGTSKYLVEAGPAIHYLSAERDVVAWKEAPGQRGQGLLALGNPAFDHRSLLAAGETRAVGPVARGHRSSCADFQGLRFKALPSAAREVDAVTRLWARRQRPGTAGEVLGLVGAEASEAGFKERAKGRRVLHLATHGFFVGSHCESPLLLSGLALAGANRRAGARPEEDDGILTAEEIAALDLSGVEWAVLSGCDTGRGEIKTGEGVMGLRRAFLTAGTGTVIMSLWPVEDLAARQWMEALYEGRLIRGLDTATAVREASLGRLRRLREGGRATAPALWAGFVAVGDWR